MDKELEEELALALDLERDIEYDVVVVIEKVYRVSVMAKNGMEAVKKVSDMQTTQIYDLGKDVMTEVKDIELLEE
jgi:hypothetical protein